ANTNNGQAFVVDVSWIKQTTKSIYVVAESTESSAQKHGLMMSILTVDLNLTTNVKKEKVDAKGVNVEYNLSETNPGEVITVNDKESLKVAILDQLHVANSNTIIKDNTFEINLDNLTLNDK